MNGFEHIIQRTQRFQPTHVARSINHAALILHIVTCFTNTRRADANLYKTLGINQPLLNCFIDPSAVPRWLVKMAIPCIAMRIEMQYGERFLIVCMICTQQSQCDRMVTPQPTHVMVGNHGWNLLDQTGTHTVNTGIRQHQIAIICEMIKWRDIKIGMRTITQHLTGLANRTGTKTRPRTIGHCTVIGNAGNRKWLVAGTVWYGEKSIVAVVSVGHHYSNQMREGKITC